MFAQLKDAIRDGKGGVGRRVWMTKSLDAGANWTTPLELTFSVKPAGWTWYATGPGGAIVTRNGTLVAPAALHKLAAPPPLTPLADEGLEAGLRWQWAALQHVFFFLSSLLSII